MSLPPFPLGSRPTLPGFLAVARGLRKVSLPGSAAKRMEAARRRLLKAAASRPVYGVNTGFGDLASRRIAPEDLKKLQRNLVVSHSCGTGEPLEDAEARGIVFLRANEIARGFSGARPEVARLLCAIVNSGAVPLIPERGSVGASGDLAPLAHMALSAIGEGRFLRNGRSLPAAPFLRKLGLQPLELEAKEGLSLLNGTQAMQSVGGSALARALGVLKAAQVAGAASLEALAGTPEPFREEIHRLKPHPGQIRTAAELRALLKGSEIRLSHLRGDPRVQDPYSLRAMPQAHGAALDAVERSIETLEIEMGSSTDNPLVCGDDVVSGANFHGQALSLAFDTAAVAMTMIGNISERRLFLLTSARAPGLKPFLAGNPGLESGWMIPHVAAAALCAENKILSHPASADTIPTSGGQEDFVSMGMTAALKLKRVVWNAAHIVAIELLAAERGIEMRSPLKPGRGVREALDRLSRALPSSPKSPDEESPALRIDKTRELILAGLFY